MRQTVGFIAALGGPIFSLSIFFLSYQLNRMPACGLRFNDPYLESNLAHPPELNDDKLWIKAE